MYIPTKESFLISAPSCRRVAELEKQAGVAEGAQESSDGQILLRAEVGMLKARIAGAEADRWEGLCNGLA
jgi:hypothetical protein